MSQKLSQKPALSINSQNEPPFKVDFVLITKTSGVPIYYQGFNSSGTPNDMTLLSGFTSAILSLSDLLQLSPKVQEVQSTEKFYYFGSNHQKFYIYQSDNFNTCISITLSNFREAMNYQTHNQIINLVEKVYKRFNRITKNVAITRNSKEDTDDLILSPEIIKNLKKSITSLLSETVNDELTHHYFLLMEEIIESHNLNEEKDIDFVVQSLTELFREFLKQ